MEAVYITGLLGTLAYLISNDNNTTQKKDVVKISKNEEPSVNNLYETEHYNKTMKKLIKKNNKAYNKSIDKKDKNGTNIIPLNKKEIENDRSNNFSRLADVDLGDFKHNNMEPFFGAKVTQNMNLDYDDGKLDRFTGVDKFYQPKKVFHYLLSQGHHKRLMHLFFLHQIILTHIYYYLTRHRLEL